MTTTPEEPTTPTTEPAPATPPAPEPEPAPEPVNSVPEWARLYVPKRSECNAALEESKAEYRAILSPKWDIDGMTCSHGSHEEDVPA